ncbi:intermembrane transport protein PqiB [Neisseria leonii]|uniref:Intermembrane transport protein PqiB n=1 Tax=Neisseria leonii TaxID=2995413 RepID=A0A9X4E184_9NEIS|nr:intermembrane transport protein PqiB [Neisseria sp. 51.81]MDD9327650.1 intermembrane transport protein PqiB [Neisseria sp. 51.81]
MSNPNPPSEPVSARIRQTRTLISTVWLVPLTALLIGAWLLVQHIRSSGPEITLYMDSAEGIEVNNTVIRVLSVNVGRITQIRLREDKPGVALTAKLTADAADMMRSDTQFWVVKPRIDQSGISGLNTLVSGAYIAFTPGTSGEMQTVFTVSDLPPITAIGQSGIRLRLSGSNTRLLEAGSPVIFENFPVGHIESARFDPKSRRVNYTIFINRPNDSLITPYSQFWLDSGIHLNTTGTGVKIDGPPLPALLSGAIAFSTPKDRPMTPAANNTRFELYNDRQSIDNLPGERALYYVTFFKQSVRGLAAGSPVEYKGVPVGSVADVPYFGTGDSLKLFQNGWIPVRIRIEPDRIEQNGDRQSKADWQNAFQTALNRGLHASLTANNLLLGSKMIELTDAPAAAKLKPFAEYSGNTVIASSGDGLDQIQNQIGALLDKLNKLPLEQTVGELNSSLSQLRRTLQSADKLLGRDSTQAVPGELNRTLAELRAALAGISPQSPVYQDVRQTLDNLDKTLRDAQPLLNTLKEKPNALIFNQNAQDPVPKGSR